MPNKILVIDDDNDMCLLLSRFLTRHGFEVATVGTGAAALDWMKKSEPLLVLCDFRLGDMTGAEMLSKIKEKYPAGSDNALRMVTKISSGKSGFVT